MAKIRSRERRAFTLIELLTVMAIILVLAGLILAVAGSANYNAAKSRAGAEVKAIETALESYKTDNGAYPESTPTDTLNPAMVSTPTNVNPTSSQYQNASQYLYQELTGIRLGATTPGKAYYLPKNSQLGYLSPATVASNTSPNMYLTDPFGFSYGYSTAYAKAAADAAATPGSTPAPGSGYNPTFDLWSTAGYAPGVGRSLPNGMTGTAADYNTLWVKNW